MSEALYLLRRCGEVGVGFLCKWNLLTITLDLASCKPEPLLGMWNIDPVASPSVDYML